MSDKERARVYTLGLLGLALLSPLVVFGLMRTGFTPRFDVNAFIAVLVACMPAVVLLELALQQLRGVEGRSSLWVKKPAVDERFALTRPIDVCRNEVVGRLRERGFNVRASPETRTLHFHKPKKQPTSGFLDSAFSGEASFAESTVGTEVTLRLQMDDILLLDTGETRIMRSLARYLALDTDAFIHREVPFMLYCGAFAAFASGVVAIAAALCPVVFDGWLTGTSLAALGLLAFVLALMLLDRKHLEGYRLLLASVYVAAYPYLALLS